MKLLLRTKIKIGSIFLFLFFKLRKYNMTRNPLHELLISLSKKANE
jgi:hypothetical protein